VRLVRILQSSQVTGTYDPCLKRLLNLSALFDNRVFTPLDVALSSMQLATR